MSRFSILSVGALATFAVLAAIVGATRLDGARRLPLLGEDRLASAAGMNPNEIIGTTHTCAWLQARRYADGVPADACGANNVGTSCIDCNSSGTNIDISPVFIPEPDPPGIVLAQIDIPCGPETIGTCAVVDGVPICDDEGTTGNQCPMINEYNNQSS